MIRSKGTACAGPSVSDLVARAKQGDQQAWDALVDRYSPLVWSICRRHRQARGEPPGSGAAAHPAYHFIHGKAVLHAPCLEPIDIHRIGQVP
jgi:hypothetical protein